MKIEELLENIEPNNDAQKEYTVIARLYLKGKQVDLIVDSVTWEYHEDRVVLDCTEAD